MNKSFSNILCMTILIGSFLLVSQASATEKDDAKKFGPKSLITMEKPINVVFDHRVHTEQTGLACNSCHDALFVMQRGRTPLKEQTMTFLAKGKFCGVCHDGRTAFASNTRCNDCHIKSKSLNNSDSHPHPTH